MLRNLFLATSLLVSFLLSSSNISAQGPAADWRTIESEHFRWHYPAVAKAWVDDLAPKLEAIRQRVNEDVGYAPPEKVDVVVMDPISRANGSAWPMLGWPRMILYTTPPGPDSVIGHYDDWKVLLAVHEEVHLAHLLRPSRHPLRRRLGDLIPIGPVAQKSPRWVSEGYATVLEGQITGYGRPHSDLRAAILRRWAQQGELPSYAQMSADGERWLGMSMAYLMGSAYLEWLQQRQGPNALRDLWARLAARQQRSFDKAFRGVFGDSPRKLYNRFCAELTFRALSLEQELAPQGRGGELWQDLSWTSGAPVVSADGQRLAMVLRSKTAPPRIVVWSTDTDDDAVEKLHQRRQDILAQDPDDVLSVHTGPLPRQSLHTLIAQHGAQPRTPRWLANGEGLLFVRFEPDTEGFFSPDLFLWNFGDTPSATRSNNLKRLTFGAGVRDPDPAPDGTWAVAVRHRYGRSELVRVDLNDGEIFPLEGGHRDGAIAFPRISPDGTSLTYVRQQSSGWQLVVHSIDAQHALGPATLLSTPPGARITHPAWHADSQHLYVSLGYDGFIDLYRIALDEGGVTPLTQSQGAAIAPAPTPDGQAVLYLSLESDGFDLRRLDLSDLPPSGPFVSPLSGLTATRRRELEPAIPPLPLPEATRLTIVPRPSESAAASETASSSEAALSSTTALSSSTVPSSGATPSSEAGLSQERLYGLGQLEVLPLLGGRITVDQDVLEVGARVGDLLGRFNLLALGATASTGGVEGGAFHLKWRGGPVVWQGHLFALTSTKEDATAGLPGLFDDYRGLELAASQRWQRRTMSWQVQGGAQFAELRQATSEELQTRRLAFLDTRLAGNQRWGNWRLVEQLQLGAELGRTGNDDWHRLKGRVSFEISRSQLGRLGLSWRRGETSGVRQSFELYQLGGTKGSLLSPFALSQQIDVAALPRGTSSGDAFDSYRLELQPGHRPWTLFYERHRLKGRLSPNDEPLALRGIEVRWKRGPSPMLRLPGLDVAIGIAEILDTPFEGDIEGWLTLSWNP